MKGQTFSAYSKLIKTLVTAGYAVYTVDEYIKEKPEKKAVILRHDIDVNAHKALQLAKLEKNLGVKSTFYFRYIPTVFNMSVIKSISKMGFEIGYHYETLDKSYGDFPEAILLFENELQSFRKFVQITTVCSHGNVVRNKHYHGSNYDIFKFDQNLLTKCNLSAEAYLSMSSPSLVYLSDSIDRTSIFGSVDDLIQEIQLSKDNSYYILFHPCLWANGTINSLQIRLKKTLFHFLTKASKTFRKTGNSVANPSQKIGF